MRSRIGRLALALALLGWATGVDAAVTVRNRAETIETITGNTTVTEPTNCANGDALLGLALAASAATITRPTSWTQLYSGTQGGVKWDVSWISRSGTPSLTWTVTGTSIYREVFVVCMTGSATVTLDSQSSAGASGNAANHKPDPPATTAVQTTSLAICGGLNFDGSASAWTAPAGYAIQTTNAVGDDGILASKSLSASGSENPAAFGDGTLGTNDYWDGFTVTFTDTAGAPACTPTLTLIGVGRCGD